MDKHPIVPASYFRLPTYRESHGRRFHPYPRYGPPLTVKPLVSWSFSQLVLSLTFS
ncbi:hypothetical protein CPB85DRAFT_1306884 [Mucidula mucida]|nr:hypothetical protein CPB85DRAFT_1306884 [Mucidula mucida]